MKKIHKNNKKNKKIKKNRNLKKNAKMKRLQTIYGLLYRRIRIKRDIFAACSQIMYHTM